MQDSLRRRIRELEADNVSLAAAASEAAALVEEYAADAAAFRRGQSASQATDAALVTELTDAARRKDRRINRLTSLLAAEKESSAKLSDRVSELEEAVSLGDEMEATLRASMEVLQSRVSDGVGAGESAENCSTIPLSAKCGMISRQGREEGAELFLDVADNRIAGTLLRGFKYFFSDDDEDAHAIISALEVARAGVSIMQIVTLAQARLLQNGEEQYHSSVHELVMLCSAVYGAADSGVRWCFEEGSDIVRRTSRVKEEISRLEQRIRTFCTDICIGEDVFKWDDSYRRMKVEVVQLALNSVCFAIQIQADSCRQLGAVDSLLDTVFEGVKNRAFSWQEQVSKSSRDSAEVTELRKQAEVAERAAERRKREAEELRVRAEVFEERVGKARGEFQEEAAVLRERACVAEKSLADALERVERAVVSAREGAGETGGNNKSRRFDEIDAAREARRLRSILVRRNVRDLCERSSVKENEGLHLGLWQAGQETLAEARKAAANASVVKLERGSLRVKREGCSMSMMGVARAVVRISEAVTASAEDAGKVAASG